MAAALLPSKGWVRGSAAVFLGCFALAWYAHARHPAWLDGALPILVDLATFGLAFLGGYVALVPPKEDDGLLKKRYVFAFATLFAVGMIANGCLRNIEKQKQDVLQQKVTDAGIRFSADLKAVKASSDAILNFVAHPPKGFTREEVVSVVEQFLKEQQIVPNDVLRSMAMDVTQRMRTTWQRFNHADTGLEELEALSQGQRRQDLVNRRAKLWSDVLSDNSDLLAEANFIRDQILKKIGTAGEAQAWVSSGPHQLTNFDRLEKLAEKLPQ
jgi:hypothetical protein